MTTELIKEKIQLADVPVTLFQQGMGNERKMIICNAVGLPFGLVAPAFSALARYYHCITWESRGVPGYFGGELSDVLFDSQVKDLLAIGAGFGGPASVCVGYCTGAMVMLGALRENPALFGKYISYHGTFAYEEPAAQRTEIEIGMWKLLKMVSKSVRAAKNYNDLSLQQNDNLAREGDGSGVRYEADIAGNSESAFLDMTSAHLRDAEKLYVYANILLDIVGRDMEPLTRGIDTPIDIHTSHNDQLAHHTQSEALHANLRHSSIRYSDANDHYSMYFKPEEVVRLLQAA